MSEFIWQNGVIVEAVSFPMPSNRKSAGFWLGDGLFETMLAQDGEVFALDRHLRRLNDGVKQLDLQVDEDQVADGLLAAMQWLGFKSGQVRVTVLSSSDLLVTAKSHETDATPLKLIVYPFPKNQRSILTGVKTLSYGENGAALRFAARHDCDDVLFLNQNGFLMESALANLIVWNGGSWLTPSLRSGCLPGVTRELLIEQFDVVEEEFGLEEIGDFSAMALTSSLRDIQSVRSLEGDTLARLSFDQEPVDRLRAHFQDWRKKNVRP